MRVKSVLRKLLGLCASAVVVGGWELVEDADGGRPTLVVKVRRRARQRGRCGRCGAVAPWFDQGGGTRRWRHLDVGFATCELVGDAPRVSCPTCGVTVAEVSFARHDSAFTRAFEDLVVFDAICSSKLAAARRHGVSWRAVDHMCIRVAREALGRVRELVKVAALDDRRAAAERAVEEPQGRRRTAGPRRAVIAARDRLPGASMHSIEQAVADGSVRSTGRAS